MSKRFRAMKLACSDGKARPVRPGSSVLVTGSTNRVDLLRGFGNAIVALLAAEVIKAAMASFKGAA